MIVELDRVRCWDFGAIPLDIDHDPLGWPTLEHRDRYTVVFSWVDALFGVTYWDDWPGTVIDVTEGPDVHVTYPDGTTEKRHTILPFPLAAWLARGAA